LDTQKQDMPEQNSKSSINIGPPNSCRSKTELLKSKSKSYKPKRKPKKEYPPCPKKYEPYLEAWEYHTGKVFRGMNSSYAKSWKVIRDAVLGKFFNNSNTPTINNRFFGYKLTLDDFIYTLENFNLIRNNADYYPKDKTKIKRISLDTFFYNAFNPNTKNKSYFIDCLTEEPKLLVATIKDPDPEFTSVVIDMFQKHHDLDLSNGGRQHAIRCMQRLTKFFKDNKEEILYYDNQYAFLPQQVGALVDMFHKNSSPDYPINPIYLHSDLTYNKLLPNYLREINAMRVN